MIDPLFDEIALAITNTLPYIFSEAAKEMGKSFAKDAYGKIKKLFRKGKQKLVLDEFEKNPQSQLTQENLKKELSIMLSNSRELPEEMLPVFGFMSVNAAILATTFRSYMVLKARHRNSYELLTDAKSGTEKYYEKETLDLAKRMHKEYDKIIKMLHGKNNHITDANI